MPPLTEEKTKWTPGPWAVLHSFPEKIVPEGHVRRSLGGSVDEAEDRDRFALVIASANRNNYSGFAHEIPEAQYKANARLIAAAPDLYDACECAEAVVSIVEPRSDKKEYLGCLAKLRAALAKARGDA